MDSMLGKNVSDLCCKWIGAERSYQYMALAAKTKQETAVNSARTSVLAYFFCSKNYGPRCSSFRLFAA